MSKAKRGGKKRELEVDPEAAVTADEPAPSPSKAAIPQPPHRTSRLHHKFISLTTHAGIHGVRPTYIKWGAPTSEERGPVLATNINEGLRNAIGAHSGSYSIYRALAVASGALDPTALPNLQMTAPSVQIGPFPSWFDPKKIVTIDPYGHVVLKEFADYIAKGYDIRPTIAVTKAHIELPELKQAVLDGLVKPDGEILHATGQANVTKAAVEPVWYLPGVAERFGCDEGTLRQCLFHETNGMYPELITRPDLKVFLPPIGGLTIYCFGDLTTIPNPDIELTVRVHDECNGSDVFGSDICTCRPYLVHGIEECVKTAQRGGAGLIIYYRKEGRALGEVTKYLVYNRRKRQEGGDTAAEYFNCTQHVAGVMDMRFQALMPDALHWIGVTRIHRLVSMSDMKYDAITRSGIEVLERVPIPKEMIPADAHVEIDAKVSKGYHGGTTHVVTEEELRVAKGRTYGEKGDPLKPGFIAAGGGSGKK